MEPFHTRDGAVLPPVIEAPGQGWGGGSGGLRRLWQQIPAESQRKFG